MKAASVSEIKKELKNLDEEQLQEICMRLIKYKKENKELVTYLLFEADNEAGYIESVKTEMEEEFQTLPRERNSYFIKKSLRKILRIVNRQVRYSGLPQTELELRIYFCMQVKEARVPMPGGTVLFNLYQQQLKKIETLLGKLPEDLLGDYEKDLRVIRKG
jgi:membrane-anchored protein YejM (alkaline phosphatase superfamily)